MKRDPWLDNVKMALVTVVVVGHVLLLAPDHDGPGLRNQLYTFIYFWHIPAFVFVTGFFSRSFQWTRRHLVALFTTIGIPFVLFELAMYEYREIVGGEQVTDPLWINPHWPMWYLIAVLLWRLMTPALRAHWVMVPLSVVASLLFGAEGSTLFDLDRVVGLLPFFTLGLHLRADTLVKLRSVPGKLVAAPALVTLWLMAGTAREWLGSNRWLWYSWNYQRMGVDFAEGAETRLKVLALGIVGTLAVIALIPRRGGWFSRMGQWTLVVYLIHGFVIRTFVILEYPEWAYEQGNWILFPTVGFAICLALFLAWDPVARRLNVLCDPWGAWQRRRAVRATTAV